MTNDRFQHVFDGVCDIAQVPRIELAAAADEPVAFHLKRGGVAANVLYFPQACPDHAFVVVEFGPLPPDDPRIGGIVLALLDANFLVPTEHPPAVGRHPVTGDIVLRCVYPLAEATSGGLMALIDQGVALALEWRSSYFLAAQVPEPGADASTPQGPAGNFA